MCPSETGFLTQCDSFRFMQVVAYASRSSLLLVNHTPGYECTIVCLNIHLLKDI